MWKTIFGCAIGALFLWGLASCLKNDDLGTPGDPGLTNYYCNDPRASNYNKGFPGIPNDSVCTYPIDPFIGSWSLTDSVLTRDSQFIQVDQLLISFQSTEDTALSHLNLMGLCPNGSPIAVTANKFGSATVDSFDAREPGQFFCSPADTVMGTLAFNFDQRDTLKLIFIVKGADSVIHLGTAVRP